MRRSSETVDRWSWQVAKHNVLVTCVKDPRRWSSHPHGPQHDLPGYILT
ncbi:conserved domain protein [ [[Propionibacterium] namnetense SK182B-JCVI]|uniref:Conserved domain protein n=1 Tax=[Propionibacterium] namnetense SK182B-JCVI TaxID=1051006 RepID=F9NSL7_9ACTN|nr:conserved domain protein [ [[Propionibacterium] namnetense SK182B-JCVI]